MPQRRPGSHRDVQPCWLTSKKSDEQTFPGKAFGTRQTTHPVLAPSHPFQPEFQHLQLCPKSRAWLILQRPKNRASCSPPSSPRCPLPPPPPCRQPGALPSPHKTTMNPQENPSLVSPHDFPADSASALLSPEAHKNCKLIIQRN